MIYGLDTSAINRLHDDPDREPLVAGILASGLVRITALNVLEASGTADIRRRCSLIRLQKTLSKGAWPLPGPNDLLRKLAVAYSRNDNRPKLAAHRGIWSILNNPAQVDENLRQEEYLWKKKLENAFRESHKRAREQFHDLLPRDEVPRPPSASALLKYYWSNEGFLHDVIAPVYRRFTDGLRFEKTKCDSSF